MITTSYIDLIHICLIEENFQPKTITNDSPKLDEHMHDPLHWFSILSFGT